MLACKPYLFGWKYCFYTKIYEFPNVLFLPPYSPDFNPIEKMWSKVKSILRKLKIRDLNNLSDAIKFAFSSVATSDCVGWFCSAFVV